MLNTLLNVAYAQGIIPIPHPTGLENTDALVGQVCNAATWLFAAAIIFSVIQVLLAAYGYMSSAGDPGKIKTANQRILYTAIGVAIALIAFLFPGIIANIVHAGTLGKVC